MSKTLTVKHTCDHTCDHISKSKKSFQDPVLESISQELESRYVEMTENMLSEIFAFLHIPQEELKKGLGGHKYVKRTGSPGNYKYWYKLPNGKLVEGDNAPAGHIHYNALGGTPGPKGIQEQKHPKKQLVVKEKPIKFSDEEKEILRGWQDSDIASDIRKLQGGPSNDNWKYDEDTAKQYLDKLDQIFPKLKVKNGPINRGISLDGDSLKSFLKQIETGIYENPSYSSFSVNNPMGMTNIQLKIVNNTHGRSINDIGSKFDFENEVIVPKGVKYKVRSIDKKDNKYIISLEELNPKSSIDSPSSKAKITVKSNKKKVVVSSKDSKKQNKQIEYKSKFPQTNLVGSVDFQNTSPKTQKTLHTVLNNAEMVMARMGLQLKTPIHFFTTSDPTQKAEAFYHPEGNKVEFVKKDVNSASIMHEIGHTIDIALNKRDNYLFDETVERIESGKLKLENMNPSQKIIMQIINEAQNTPYYKESEGDHAKYINSPTEIFARAFEVYSYKIANDLVKMGKMDKSFIDNFMPDLNHVPEFNNTEDFKKFNEKNQQLNQVLQEAAINKDKEKYTQAQMLKERNLKEAQIKKREHEQGTKNEEFTNKMAGLVEQFLKLEKIKKSL